MNLQNRKNMETIDNKPIEMTKGDSDGTPVCVKCFRQIDPLLYYCSNCGEASGQFTQYIPFVNIRWQASVWKRMWRQIWSSNVSIPGRVFRFLMIIWNAPIMLIGLIFQISNLFKRNNCQHENPVDT